MSVGSTGPGASRSGGPPNGTTAMRVGLSQPSEMTISKAWAVAQSVRSSAPANALAKRDGGNFISERRNMINAAGPLV